MDALKKTVNDASTFVTRAVQVLKGGRIGGGGKGEEDDGERRRRMERRRRRWICRFGTNFTIEHISLFTSTPNVTMENFGGVVSEEKLLVVVLKWWW